MAVFTPLTANDISAFLHDYDVGGYDRHENIMQGVENSNFHLWTTTGRYILTVFESRIDRGSLPFVFGFQDHLRAGGVICPTAITNKNGERIGTIKGKPAAIVEFLNGKTVVDADITAEQAHNAGVALAKMHIAADNFAMHRDNPVNINVWRDLYERVEGRLDDEAKAVIDRAFQDVESVLSVDLPVGAIHADYFTDNVFFDDAGQVCGVIDFYFACTGVFAYDLAMALNAWPHESAVLQGYESVRPLLPEEAENLKTLRKAAALRILMTRYYDWFFTPDDAEITPKDPLEYLGKLRNLG